MLESESVWGKTVSSWHLPPWLSLPPCGQYGRPLDGSLQQDGSASKRELFWEIKTDFPCPEPEAGLLRAPGAGAMGRCGAGAAVQVLQDPRAEGWGSPAPPGFRVTRAGSEDRLVTYRSAFLRLRLPVTRPPSTAYGGFETLMFGKPCSAAKQGHPVHRMCLPQIFDPTKHPPADLGAVIPQGL